LKETTREVQKDIIDIRGPVDLPGGFPFRLLAILALLVIAAVAAKFLIKKFGGKERVLPPRPAHEIAYDDLRDLKMRGLPGQGRIKEYYIALSFIVRQYLENRFALRAPEMTTEEFLIAAKNRGEFSSELKALLKDFLLHCDLVKFAKYGPTPTEMDLSFESAKRLVDQTKERAAEVTA